MCDIGIDLFDVADILEVVSFSREKLELDATLFDDNGEQNILMVWFF
jgi:hypothetical protein